MFNQPHIKMEDQGVQSVESSPLYQKASGSRSTVQLSVDDWDASIGRS